jgi:hypothetical protein
VVPARHLRLDGTIEEPFSSGSKMVPGSDFSITIRIVGEEEEGHSQDDKDEDSTHLIPLVI